MLPPGNPLPSKPNSNLSTHPLTPSIPQNQIPPLDFVSPHLSTSNLPSPSSEARPTPPKSGHFLAENAAAPKSPWNPSPKIPQKGLNPIESEPNFEPSSDSFPPLPSRRVAPANGKPSVFSPPLESASNPWSKAGPISPRPQRKVRLRFIPPTLRGSGLVGVCSAEAISGELQVLDYTVVGFFLGKKPGFSFVRANLLKQWHLSGSVDVLQLPHGGIAFRFSSLSDRDMVLEVGVFHVGGQPLFLQRWERNLHSGSILGLKKVPLWVTLPGLPLHLWGEESLSVVGSILGKPLYTDSITAQKSRWAFARLCIEFSGHTPLLESVTVEDDEGNIFYQPVKYEWKPSQCISCGVFGHTLNSCQDTPGLVSTEAPYGKNAEINTLPAGVGDANVKISEVEGNPADSGQEPVKDGPSLLQGFGPRRMKGRPAFRVEKTTSMGLGVEDPTHAHCYPPSVAQQNLGHVPVSPPFSACSGPSSDLLSETGCFSQLSLSKSPFPAQDPIPSSNRFGPLTKLETLGVPDHGPTHCSTLPAPLPVVPAYSHDVLNSAQTPVQTFESSPHLNNVFLTHRTSKLLGVWNPIRVRKSSPLGLDPTRLNRNKKPHPEFAVMEHYTGRFSDHVLGIEEMPCGPSTGSGKVDEESSLPPSPRPFSGNALQISTPAPVDPSTSNRFLCLEGEVDSTPNDQTQDQSLSHCPISPPLGGVSPLLVDHSQPLGPGSTLNRFRRGRSRPVLGGPDLVQTAQSHVLPKSRITPPNLSLGLSTPAPHNTSAGRTPYPSRYSIHTRPIRSDMNFDEDPGAIADDVEDVDIEEEDVMNHDDDEDIAEKADVLQESEDEEEDVIKRKKPAEFDDDEEEVDEEDAGIEEIIDEDSEGKKENQLGREAAVEETSKRKKFSNYGSDNENWVTTTDLNDPRRINIC